MAYLVRLLAFALLLSFGSVAARATCVPTNATPGMIGCWPLVTTMSPTQDYMAIWQPGPFPASANLISPANFFTNTPPVLVGTGTTTGLPYQFQTAINADPSALPALNRQTMFQTTLSYASTSTNIWEGLTQFTTVNGPGTASGEINGIHSYMQFNANATIVADENFEASMENFGTISGTQVMFLGAPHNESTGSVPGSIIGSKEQLVNDNTTSGSIGQWIAYDCEAMSGAGSKPTFNSCFRNADINQAIVSLGPLSLGNLTAPSGGTLLSITGSDSSGGTFPVSIKNSAAATALAIADDTTVYFGGLNARVTSSGGFQGTSAILGISGTTIGSVVFYNAFAGGHALILTPNGGSDLGNKTVSIPAPSLSSDAIALLGLNQTFSAFEVFSGTLDVTGTLEVGGNPGVTCSGSPTSSFSSQNGVVTHC